MSAPPTKDVEMVADNDEQSILEQIGDPADVVRALRRFRRSANSLSKQYRELANRYPGQWVAVFDGKVRAHGATFEAVMHKIDQEGLPREHALVRFIDNDDRIMI